MLVVGNLRPIAREVQQSSLRVSAHRAWAVHGSNPEVQFFNSGFWTFMSPAPSRVTSSFEAWLGTADARALAARS